MSESIEIETGDPVKPSSSRQRIVDIAHRLFIEDGYPGVSMQQIANAAGLRKASLYHHFPSKEALFAEVMAQELDRLLVEFNQSDFSSGTIQERLTRLARINYQRFDQPEIHQLAMDFFRYVPEPEHDGVHQRLREIESVFARIFAEAIDAGELHAIDPYHAATMFFHMMMALGNDPNDYRRLPPPPPDEAAALVARVFIHGLGA